MTKSLFKAFSVFTILALMLMALPMQSGGAISTTIVISQVYGGGGNSGAQYTNDFIELFNRGTSTVSLAGWSVQYTSATGTGNFGSATNLITPLSGSLTPGQYMLVQEAAGATPSAPLPTPDVTDSTPINMAAGGGKVALVNTTTPLGCNGGSNPCSPAALATIVDLIGWDGANFFEGSVGPTTSNTSSAIRVIGGCQDTDKNSVDFALASPPTPRNTASPLNVCPIDIAPSVLSTSPASNETSVDLDSNITISFSEPVNVTGNWFSISCADSGSHTASVIGGPTNFTLDPDADFTSNESCTVTISASQVTDQDLLDPPDNMDADYLFSFVTLGPPTFIHDIQGASHISPKNGMLVTNVNGIVIAKRSNGFYMQDPNPDSDDATSEGIFVFTSSAPSVNVGDAVRVGGTVQEFRPGGVSTGNLTTTEISNPGRTVKVLSSSNSLPAATIIGTGGRMPPTENIEDDTTGDVETSGVFDPATDGIDFYESMEGMLVQVNNPLAVGPTNAFGETPVVPDNGSWAGLRTPRGGVLLQPNDGNPERLVLDDLLVPIPPMNVGDHLDGAVIGALDYNFGNFFLEVTTNPLPPLVSGGLTQEVTTPAGTNQLAVATFNVENLAPTNPASKFNTLAGLVVNNLKAPDILAIEEIQDNNGAPASGECPAVADGVVDASQTWGKLIAAIQNAGGPTYNYRQIDPMDCTDGGAPGGNIRQGFLFRTDRGLSFIDRPGAGATTANAVLGSGPNTQLQYSPGRIDPTNTAFDDSRKPLAGEFMYRGLHLFVIANHFNSKGGDNPLFGHFQPPVRSSEVQRHQQAQIVHDFVNSLKSADPDANVVVLGDLNDFQFSDTLNILKGTPPLLGTLMDTLPLAEQYSYDFEGNSQALDHTLLSTNMLNTSFYTYDVVHVNSEFATQASDHEPQVTTWQTYNFNGFFQPVDNLPVLNVVKAGQGIPVKFSLSGNQGLSILATGYPQSMQISCDSSEPQDAIEQTVTAGNSSLSYDPTTDTYTYVWKTDKAWANSCRQLVVKLIDGTLHEANFQFTK